jgi:hypothetical protein
MFIKGIKMNKYLMCLLTMLSTGCVSKSVIKSNFREDILQGPICYVDWKDPNDNLKYIMGYGKSKEEKIKQSLQFSSQKNGGVLILGKISPTQFAVVFDILEPLRVKKVKEIQDQYFYELDRQGLETLVFLTGQVFKVNSSELKTELKDYEEVDCHNFFDSQYAPYNTKDSE